MNTVAFSGSNYLFSTLRSSGVDEECKRHDKAIEQLQATQAAGSTKRTDRLDWINAELHRHGHAVQTFQDVEVAIREYAKVFPNKNITLTPESKLSHFYLPSHDQKDREIAFVILGMAAAGLVVYKLAK